MDINGARALARRVGPRVDSNWEASAAGGASEVTLPVFQWFGIDQPQRDQPQSQPATGPLPTSRGARRPGRFSLRRG
jgi:hypothetical protein